MSDQGLSRDPSLSDPVFRPNLSGNLGKALGAGDDLAAKIPGAVAADKERGEKEKAIAREYTGKLETADAKRADADARLRPPLPPILPPPEQKNTSPVEAWGSLAMSLAVLGSAFTRRPLQNSLNSAAEVMKAHQQKDTDAYKTAMDRWKAENDYAIKNYEFQRDYYKDALEMIATDEKQAVAILKAKAVALGHPEVKALLDEGKLAEAVTVLQEGPARLADFKDKSALSHVHAEAVLRVDRATKAFEQNPNDPAAQQELKAAADAAKALHTADKGAGSGAALQNQERESALYDRLVAQWQNDPKNEGKEFTADVESRIRSQAHGAVMGRGQMPMEPTLDQPTLDRMADQVLAGQHNVVSGLGYGNAGAANRAALQNAITIRGQKLAAEMGIPENKIGEFLAIKSAEFAGITAGERTLGIRQVQLGLATQEAQLLMPAVLKASEDVPRTELTDLNRLLLAAETRTGDPNVVKLGIAINSFINVYARAINPTGVATISDKEHARELLAPYWSKGQIKAGLDQLNIELSSALGAPARVRQELREGLGSQTTAPNTPTPTATAAPGNTGQLPSDLPNPAGRAPGSVVKENGKVIAVLRDGKWTAPDER